MVLERRVLCIVFRGGSYMYLGRYAWGINVWFGEKDMDLQSFIKLLWKVTFQMWGVRLDLLCVD